MAVAEINLKDTLWHKNLLDTAGHYARPDILRLKLDSTPRKIMEEIGPELKEVPDETPLESREEPPTPENSQ